VANWLETSMQELSKTATGWLKDIMFVVILSDVIVWRLVDWACLRLESK